MVCACVKKTSQDKANKEKGASRSERAPRKCGKCMDGNFIWMVPPGFWAQSEC